MDGTLGYVITTRLREGCGEHYAWVQLHRSRSKQLKPAVSRDMSKVAVPFWVS